VFIKSDETICKKKITEKSRFFFQIFKIWTIFISTCFHNMFVDGLIITLSINDLSCNTMKKYIKTRVLGECVISKSQYYIAMGFD